jgi:hypothetical protein
LNRDEALAALTRRYFSARGPATLKDYSRWSGLTVAEGRSGLEMVKSGLEHETIDGRTYWFAASSPKAKARPPGVIDLVQGCSTAGSSVTRDPRSRGNRSSSKHISTGRSAAPAASAAQWPKTFSDRIVSVRSALSSRRAWSAREMAERFKSAGKRAPKKADVEEILEGLRALGLALRFEERGESKWAATARSD